VAVKSSNDVPTEHKVAKDFAKNIANIENIYFQYLLVIYITSRLVITITFCP